MLFEKQNYAKRNNTPIGKKSLHAKYKPVHELINILKEYEKIKMQNASFAEGLIEQQLKKNKIVYRKQYSFDDCRNKNPLPYDFAIFNNNMELLALIEFQGQQHYKAIDFFGGEEGFRYRRKNDNIKRKYCNNKKIRLIEIAYWEESNIPNIIDNLYKECV